MVSCQRLGRPTGSQRSLLATWAHSNSKVWAPLEIPTVSIEWGGECSSTGLSLDRDALSSPQAAEVAMRDRGLALLVPG